MRIAFALLMLLVVAVLVLYARRAGRFRARYLRDVQVGLSTPAPTALITEAELEKLPPLVQGYVRRSGAVGRAHLHDFHARMHGRIRNGDGGAWMPLVVEQHSFIDPPARLFLMRATMYGLPVEALHRYVGTEATMQVRLASLIDVVDARGDKMNQSETVTLLNDLCVLAPASLVDAPISWRTLDAHRVEATFTNAGHTVHAELTFDAAGDLVGFVSPDRLKSADGKTYESFPWSTPLRDYRQIGDARVATHGDAIYLEPRGAFPYAEFEMDEVTYNVGGG